MSVALAWLLQRSPNILLIPGTSSVEHLRENGANGMSDMAGKAAREAVEPSGSERDTMLLALAFNCPTMHSKN
jgi:pyridoxine 4-dehydrogenase